ncbi:RNA polymerase sigma factor [Fictibacillus fluitans]|uniref:Sigma-70 family RNA polymerase sigma factor n=1 Tax=Fictibacillus fluitans TaxID=3058422 RepID=A0ABT8HU54_9BACL|nr:sigma-70 family RNA polymerase sigma factor [Fictibacillus sp. NE201]MDN4524296.1 sigma-70 family RNA polymerase sigma factor [Fictibacillus sp. NE201]
MSKLTDFELYTKVQNGDKSALEQIYDRYEKLLFSFAFRMTQNKDTAEDVIQEVFIKLWRKKGVYSEEKGKFSSWLLTVTRNTCLDFIRKAKGNEVELEDRDSLVKDEMSVEDQITWKEERQKLKSAMHLLADEQQKVVDLFYFKGMSQQKIAEECGIPLGTVKGRIRLALKHLKEKYKAAERGGTYGPKNV